MQEAGVGRSGQNRDRGWLVALGALALAACVLLHEALFGGQVMTQADALYQFPPWTDVAPEGFEPENPLLLDQAIVMQPWMYFGAERVRSGVLPWWNPDNYLGQPMVGTYQTAYFWPLNWPYLATQSWGFFAWSAFARLIAAGFLTYLFLRAIGVGAGGAIVGGIGFAFSGFMIAWLGHMHTHVALFLPAMLWAVERLAQRPTVRAAAWLALFSGCALLAGHVQTAVHIGLGVAAYMAFRALVPIRVGASSAAAASSVTAAEGAEAAGPHGQTIHHRPHPPGKIAADGEGFTSRADESSSEPRTSALRASSHAGSSAADDARPTRLAGRGLLLAIAGGALGVLLATPQLLPFLDYLSTSSGAVVLEHFETVSDVDPRDPASLLVAPGRFGSPAAEQGYGPYDGPSGWNVNYNEIIGGYVGRVILLLALLQVAWLWRARRSPQTWFFAALAVVAAGVAWQVWPFYDVANSIPKLKSTKLMRAAVLLAFALCALAAMGIDGLVRRYRLQGTRALGLHAACGVLVAVELLSFGRGYNPMIDAEHVTPRTPVTDYLRDQRGLWRLLGVENASMIPSANLFYGVPMIGGYDSMETRTTTELVALMSSDPDGEYFIKEIDYFDQAPAIANLLGTRYLMSQNPLPPPFELVVDGTTKLYENPGYLPRAFAAREALVLADADARLEFLGADTFDPRIAVLEQEPGTLATGAPLGQGEVEITEYGDLEIHLVSRLGAPGLIVVTDAWDASWKAYVDGEPTPILRVDHGLRGVEVEAGEHVIEMRYEPWALRAGIPMGALAAVLIAVGLLRRERRAG